MLWGHCCLLDSLKKGQNYRTCCGFTAAFLLLRRGGRAAEHALGSLLHSCFSEESRGQNCRTCSGVIAAFLLSSKEGAELQGSASHGQYGGLDEGCRLEKLLHDRRPSAVLAEYVAAFLLL